VKWTQEGYGALPVARPGGTALYVRSTSRLRRHWRCCPGGITLSHL